MLRINMLLKSGDAPQEFFDRHISKVRYAASGVNKRVPSPLRNTSECLSNPLDGKRTTVDVLDGARDLLKKFDIIGRTSIS